MMPTLQLNMFGPPEDAATLPEAMRYDDCTPKPHERQILWPQPHAEVLGPELLEVLYGDIPRKTRLSVLEVCRWMQCRKTHIYELVDVGSLDALDARHPAATQNHLLIYRYSLVRWAFNREFVENATRSNLPTEDLARCLRLADRLRAEKRKGC